VRITAFGGGKGLSAGLRALRRAATDLELEITAVVTVGDDGGSSGRLRQHRESLPPGDLRQALVALAGTDEVSARTAELFQHRYSGSDNDPLVGHAVGNLILVGLMERYGDPVRAVEHAGRMVNAVGRVLPMSTEPVGIEADVRGADPARPGELVIVRGQHNVAVTPGHVEQVRLTPGAPAACPEAVRAVLTADWLVFGPGSWYTSVIPHLLVPELAAAIVTSPARRLVTLNLAEETETLGLSLADHLAALRWYLPDLRLNEVIADGKAVGDPEPVARAAESLGARLVLAPVGTDDGSHRHDPAALGAALVPVLGSAR
jgi:uncharacterized cofD-like protein